ADVWSDQINRFLNGVVANLGNQIVLAEEAAQIPVELQGDTAIFELTRGTEKSVAVREVTTFGFLYAQSLGENQQNIDISEARSAESLRQKLDLLTDDRSTVSARESATDRALFNQAISAVPRIDDKPVVAVVDLSPFKNLTERDPRFESMVQVFVNAFLRDGHYLRFQGASEERIRAANDLAVSIALKLKNKDAVSGVLRQEDGNPENAFEVVLRKERSRVDEKVRDRVYVSIAEIPDDPHFVAELGSTALLMKTIGESVRFERDQDVIDSDTVHTGLISAVNILYSPETVIGLSEVLWTLSADSRADDLMIGFIRVDNVIMALRMQSRQIDIMA
ncbi:MAG: hypothetical protein KC649_01425, partial [Candidatus Omnitrophica bacterium]|nr:hypothetical protein [Candidatus Omnitrophota bacterium]